MVIVPITLKQRDALHHALTAAFSSGNDLALMLWLELEERLEDLAAPNTIPIMVMRVIQWAEMEGCLDKLVKGARKQKPGNAELRAIGDELGWRPDPLAETPPPGGSPPARDYALAARLRGHLHMFDREEQADHFESVITHTWQDNRQSLLCLVGGLPADMPRSCRDRLWANLGRHFEEAQIASNKLGPGRELAWPNRKRFNVADELEALKNGVKAQLGERRSNDPNVLREKYNGQPTAVVFFSELPQEAFSRDHELLLAGWKEFWRALGAQPLNKPLAHLLLLTFPSREGLDDRLGIEARQRFYESKFPSDDPTSLGKLPMLDAFSVRDVEDWLDALAGETRLGEDLVWQLKLRAVEEFPDSRSSRLERLDKWIRAVTVTAGEGQ